METETANFTDADKIFRENKILKLEKRYTGELNYTPNEAAKMAVAEADGDFDAKLKIQKAVQYRKEKEYAAELRGYVPPINGGMGETGNRESDSFMRGLRFVWNKNNH